MPFSIVLTVEGSSELISVVPSTWINKDSILYWPRTRKSTDLEQLRRNENSKPSDDWKKLNCKIKLQGIETFAEGLKMEKMYSKFEDTEDEERYHNQREINRKHPAKKLFGEDLLNLNAHFKMTEDKENIDHDIIENTKLSETLDATNKPSIKENANHASTSSVIFTEGINADVPKIKTTDETVMIPETENGESFVSISLNEFNQIITENSGLQAENKILKESIELFKNLKEENDKSFIKIQVQLDKLFDLMKSIKCDTNASTSISKKVDEKIAQSNIEFPINSVQQLNLLEDKLNDVEFEKALIQKFSSMCGTSGTQKINRIGLQLAGSLFTDELLYQFTWKGIKGCTKVPFITFIKIRHLFYKIIQLADSSCSVKDSDSFLQNSAIKHSGQRIKRKSAEVKISDPKKKKIESEKMNTTDNEEDPTVNNFKTIQIHPIHSDQKMCAEELNENMQDGLDDKKNKIDDIPDTRKIKKTVTVLSDIKINNKMIDLKHDTKMMNISSDDLLGSQVFDKN